MSVGGLRHAALFVLFLNMYAYDGKLIETAMSADQEDVMNKTNDFINSLKQDLRKNNDDYAELRAAISSPPNKPEIDKYYNEKVTKHALVINNVIYPSNKDAARRFGKSDNTDESATTLYPTMRRNEHKTPLKKKNPKKTVNKQEKLQKFLQKNEGLIRDFLSSRNILSTRRTSSSTPAPPPALLTTQPSTTFSAKSEGTNKVMNRILTSKTMQSKSSPSMPVVPSSSSSSEDLGGTALRQLGSYEDGADSDRVNLQKADQLDMTPAVGARMYNLRIKGRLCQRSVLFPEGPKYDSDGHAYLRAHNDSDVGHRDFASTRRPRRVLPRCCNCCKKSVLGCQ